MTSEVPAASIELLAQEYVAARRHREAVQNRIDNDWAVESARAAINQAQRELEEALRQHQTDIEAADLHVTTAATALLNSWSTNLPKTIKLPDGAAVTCRVTDSAIVPAAHEDSLLKWILAGNVGRAAFKPKWDGRELLRLVELAPTIIDWIQIKTTCTLSLREKAE